MSASNVIVDCMIIVLFTCITTVILLIREHELMSHETDSGIAGLFFNIYSFKLAKDQINTLNHEKGYIKILEIKLFLPFLAIILLLVK